MKMGELGAVKPLVRLHTQGPKEGRAAVAGALPDNLNIYY